MVVFVLGQNLQVNFVKRTEEAGVILEEVGRKHTAYYVLRTHPMITPYENTGLTGITNSPNNLPPETVTMTVRADVHHSTRRIYLGKEAAARQVSEFAPIYTKPC